MASIVGNFAAAKRLVGKPQSSLYLLPQVLHVPLPSEHLSDVKNSMLILLKEELEIYSPELDGVPVAFNEKSAKLTENYGSVVSAQPYVHCDVQCEFVVFKPKVNDILNGVVNKVTANLIGCLVHGFFYATVHRTGKDTKKLDNVKVGDRIKLSVTKLEEDGNGVLSVIGAVLSVTSRRGKKTIDLSDKEEIPLTITADSGIEYSDANASTVVSQNSAVSKAQSFTSEVTLQSDQTTSHSDSLLSPQKQKKESKKLVYRHPNSIALKSEAAMIADDELADVSVFPPESTKADNGVKEKKKRKKTKKEKKHKEKKKNKKKKKEKSKKKSSEETNGILNSNGTENIPTPRGILKKNLDESYQCSPTQINKEDYSLVTDVVNIKKEKLDPDLKNPSDVVNSNSPVPGRKTAKKRKQGTSTAFSSPPMKRTMQESTASLLPENLTSVQSGACEKRSLQEMNEISEHQRKALFHLQHLGINLPLSMLTPGLHSPTQLGSPDGLAQTISEKTDTSQSHSVVSKEVKTKSKKRSKSKPPPAWATWTPQETSTPMVPVSESKASVSTGTFTYLHAENMSSPPVKKPKVKKEKKHKSEKNKSKKIRSERKSTKMEQMDIDNNDNIERLETSTSIPSLSNSRLGELMLNSTKNTSPNKSVEDPDASTSLKRKKQKKKKKETKKRKKDSLDT